MGSYSINKKTEVSGHTYYIYLTKNSLKSIMKTFEYYNKDYSISYSPSKDTEECFACTATHLPSGDIIPFLIYPDFSISPDINRNPKLTQQSFNLFGKLWFRYFKENILGAIVDFRRF